jgi:hypothetical protein
MARRIIDYNGTVVGVGGAYPYGDIKDNPSGTIIDRTSNADLQQFFQKLLAEAGITGNGLADNVTNGYQLTEAMSKVISNHAAQIVISMLGDAYDVTKMYVLHGLGDVFTGGYVLYDGEIWALAGYIGGPCVDAYIVTPLSPVLYTSGVQSLQITCGTSGTGIVDYTDLIFINKWVDVGGAIAFGNGPGGSVTIDPADIVYAKYLLRGRTVHFQFSLRNFTVGSPGPAFISCTMPFLPSDVAQPMYYLGGVYVSPTGTVSEPCLVLTVNASTEFLQIYPPTSGWVTGTDDSGLDVSIVFEID